MRESDLSRQTSADQKTARVRRLRRTERPAHGQPDAANARIFVTIAAYRDQELAPTIANALEHAAQPDRLRFGICWQYDSGSRADLDPYVDDARFRVDAVPFKRSKGVGWARSRATGLYDGEEYVLQIDSHSRFAESWDDRLVDMLESIHDVKPLLTTYPPAYFKESDGSDRLEHGTGIQRVGLVRVNPDFTTHQLGEEVPDVTAPGKSRFLAAGLVFTRGSFVTEVPVDPGIYFLGEEISIALRAYTHGYNLYYPNENLIWHLYSRPGPKHWTDHKAWSHRNDASLSRLHSLLVGDPSSLGRYGLGTVRSRAEYEQYASIDFKARADPTRQISCQLEFELDTSEIAPRDDYDVWVFALLTADDVEIHRADIHDADVLAGRSRTAVVDAQLSEEPAKYLLWPKIRDGDWGERIVQQIPPDAWLAEPQPAAAGTG